MNIHHVMIFVADIARAKVFYSDILGIPVKQDFSEEMGMLIMEAGPIIFTLHGGFGPSRDDRGASRTCITFAVEDIDHTRQHLLAHGVVLEGDIEQSPVHRYLTFRDPFGNILEVGQYGNA